MVVHFRSPASSARDSLHNKNRCNEKWRCHWAIQSHSISASHACQSRTFTPVAGDRSTSSPPRHHRPSPPHPFCCLRFDFVSLIHSVGSPECRPWWPLLRYLLGFALGFLCFFFVSAVNGFGALVIRTRYGSEIVMHFTFMAIILFTRFTLIGSIYFYYYTIPSSC